MQKSSGVFSLLIATLLFASACSQGENTVGKRTQNPAARKTTTATTVDAGNSEDAKGKGGKGDDQDDQDDQGDEPTKGDDGDEEEPVKGDDGDVDAGDDGKDDDEDDQDDLPPPGKGDPGQTPVQTKPDPIDEPDVVVELPAEACPYFDPDQPTFVIKKDQFAAGLPPMDVPSTHIQGDLQADNETYIGAFSLFLNPNALWTLTWDGKAGRVPHDYTLVVVGASNDKCTAYLKFVKQNPRTLNGCFASDTMIRMANGKDQMIAGITAGDMVLNPVTKKATRVAEVIKGPETKPMWKVGFGGREMIITELHPVPVKGGLKQAKDVTTADYIYDDNGIIHRVTSAEALPVKPNTIVYNVRLEGSTTVTAEHMVLANGLVSGDLFLQRKMAGDGAQTASR